MSELNVVDFIDFGSLPRCNIFKNNSKTDDVLFFPLILHPESFDISGVQIPEEESQDIFKCKTCVSIVTKITLLLPP